MPTADPTRSGAALLKSVGLYPPGSFVQLVNGETGIVVARGKQANLPVVASGHRDRRAGRLAVAAQTAQQRLMQSSAASAWRPSMAPPLHHRLVAMR